jgi:lichenan operon transcriptional antiterminator
MCTRLERQGLVPTSFRAHVFEREAAASTAFGEVAIPHSVYMEAKQTTFSIGLAKDPISWGTHHVRLVILTAISQRDQHRFMRLYDALITMFGDEKMVNTLSGFETFGQFKDLVKTKMNL